MNSIIRPLLAAIVLLSAALAARAENVDLSTVPRRDSVQLTIYNSEDLTLVRETRIVTFKKGANPLQFSWANTLIDPSSVELKFLTSADKLEVLDTTFLHAKPQMLYWKVKSEMDGEATIQITYFTSGISWSADYVGIATPDEGTMNIDGFVRVTNHSGEEYEDARIRLVVGTINLVEKIAKLAQIPIEDVQKLEKSRRHDLSLSVSRESMDVLADGLVVAGNAGVPAEKQIIKQGLSEYFIYTVEGTETIPDGWSKRMRSFGAKAVPLKIQYRYRPREYGEQLVRMYLMVNDEESKLGTTPLPDGAFRVFRDNGRDGLFYLTQQSIKYIPIGDKIELNLGADPEVVFELIKLRTFRDNIWMKINDTDTFQQVGNETTERETNSTVVGWDEHSIYSQRIRNYTPKPIDVELRRSYEGHTLFRSQLKPKLFDFQTAEFATHVPSGERRYLLFEIVQRQGRKMRQSNVTLEEAEVKR